MQHGGLVLGEGQLGEAAGRRAQAAIDLAFPVGSEHQALFIGQDVQLQGRLAAVDLDHLAFERSQARQGRAVHAQDPVEPMLDAGEQAGQSIRV